MPDWRQRWSPSALAYLPGRRRFSALDEAATTLKQPLLDLEDIATSPSSSSSLRPEDDSDMEADETDGLLGTAYETPHTSKAKLWSSLVSVEPKFFRAVLPSVLQWAPNTASSSPQCRQDTNVTMEARHLLSTAVRSIARTARHRPESVEAQALLQIAQIAVAGTAFLMLVIWWTAT